MSGNKKEPAVHNPFLERELIDAIRRNSFEDLEKIPEIRNLIRHLRDEHAERARLAESFNLLPHSDLQKLFADFIQEQFDSQLQAFFGRLYNGIMKTLRATLSARMDEMEETIQDLKRSVLMASLHPYAWVESEIMRNAILFISEQPGQKAPLHDIYVYLTVQVGVPLPGVALVEKYEYIIKVLRRVSELREWDGFLFELVTHEVREERETIATSDNYREPVLLTSLRKMAKREAKVSEGVS